MALAALIASMGCEEISFNLGGDGGTSSEGPEVEDAVQPSQAPPPDRDQSPGPATGQSPTPGTALPDAALDPPSGPIPDGGGPGQEMERDAAPAATAIQCEPEEAERCAPGGHGTRQRCAEGVWTESAPCAEGETCLEDKDGAACVDTFELCAGHEGDHVCDGPVLHACSETARSLSAVGCESEQHCIGGIDGGHCLSCLQDDYRCDVANLQVCRDGAFQTVETCASASLCNAIARACTAQVCQPDQFTCDGERSQQCNADGSALSAGTPCEHGCNRATGKCYACTPSATRCDGRTRYACSASGTGETSSRCPNMCVNGECVQCTAATAALACTTQGPCETARCSGGMCNAELKQPGDSCLRGILQWGFCDRSGNCDECFGSGKAQCPGPYDVCQDGTCVRDAPSCAPNCGTGDTCQLDDDCRGTCDPTDMVCVEACVGDYPVRNQRELDAVRYCSAIEGDLDIELQFVPSRADQRAFSPYLKSVSGVVTISMPPEVDEFVIPRLETVNEIGGLVGPNRLLSLPALKTANVLGGMWGTRTIEFPALTRVQGDVQIFSGVTQSISLPKLTRIDGALVMFDLWYLTQLELSSRLTVAGEAQVFELCKFDYARFPSFTAGSKVIHNIGCCGSVTSFMCDSTCTCP